MLKKITLLSFVVLVSEAWALDPSIAAINLGAAHNMESMNVTMPLGQGMIGNRFKGLAMIHGFHVLQPLRVDANGENHYPLHSLRGVELALGYLVHSRIYLGVGLQAFQVHSNKEDFSSLEKDKRNFMLGDVNVLANIRITRNEAPIGLGVLVNVVAPTANSKMLLSDGFSAEGRLLVNARVERRLSVYGNIGYKYSHDAEMKNFTYQSGTALKGLKRDHRLVYGAGFAWTPVSIVSLGFEIYGGVTMPYKSTKDTTTTPGGVTQNPYYMDSFMKLNLLKSERLAIMASYGLEGLFDPTKPQQRFSAGLRYAFKPMVVATPAPVVTKSIVQELTQRLKIARRVQFAVNSAVIAEASYDELNKAATALKEYASQVSSVEIQGHTDNTGARDYNISLSQKRAEAIRTYLVNQGVPDKILVAKGYGPDQPLADNKTREGRAQNRRVEFIVDQDIRIKR